MALRRLMPFISIIVWIAITHAAGKFDGIPVPPLLRVLYHEDDIHTSTNVLQISSEELNHSVIFSTDIVNRQSNLENILLMSEIQVEKETPSYGQLIENQADSKAVNHDKNAVISLKASLFLVNTQCSKHGLKALDCSKQLLNYKMYNTLLDNTCNKFHTKCPKDVIKNKYRTIDGSCNNPSKSYQGMAFTSYKRLLFPQYRDGIKEPRRSVTNKILNSARLVSSVLGKDIEKWDESHTLAFVQWGQFVEHDLTNTVFKKMLSTGTSIECCHSSGRHLAPRHRHPDCQPINVSSKDPFYSKYDVTCMNYVRSVNSFRSDCSFGPAEQMNQATHFLDASHIYGSTMEKSQELREFTDGRLRTKVIRGEEYLPLSEEPLRDCQVNSSLSICFKSGNSRVNIHPHLVSMYTLWVREHNRIAAEFMSLNPAWNDEQLYQETRRVVIAELQHITYSEWKPLLLGEKFDYFEDSSEYYLKDIDPSISNSFATAAVRFINSLMDSSLRFYDKNQHFKFVDLKDYYNRPDIIIEPGSLDSLIRGLAFQKSQKLDMNFINDLTNYLFKEGPYGYDVLSLDIQRGRDHGLPGYNFYREKCGLSRANTFEDFNDVISKEIISNLRKVYSHPNDVDLIIGGLAESDSSDAVLGPTFRYLISEQFARTKSADRYFYSHQKQPTSFNKYQLNEIKNVTLARIFCDNTKTIDKIQKHVFEPVSFGNELVSCDDKVTIPRVNLKYWTDDSQ